MFLDLDNFKHINDGLGHQYGDMLLKMISLGLQQIKGIENSCYRMGGDEFVIIIEPKERKNIQLILNEVNYLFNKPWDLNGTEYYCTMSMGIVRYPDDGCDVNELIKKQILLCMRLKRLVRIDMSIIMTRRRELLLKGWIWKKYA